MGSQRGLSQAGVWSNEQIGCLTQMPMNRVEIREFPGWETVCGGRLGGTPGGNTQMGTWKFRNNAFNLRPVNRIENRLHLLPVRHPSKPNCHWRLTGSIWAALL